MPHGHAPASSSGRRHTSVTVSRHYEVGAAPTHGLWAALSSAYDSGPSCISPTRSGLHSSFQAFQLQESSMLRSSDRQLPGTSPAPQPTSPIPAQPGYRHRHYGLGEAETAAGSRSCNGKLRQAQSAPMDVQPRLQWREKNERMAVCRHQECEDDEEDDDSEEEKDGRTPAAVACRGGCAGGEGEEEEERLPPHELVAREWASATSYGGSAFSVCQGVGRTLKGRDLCRVRNAILKQTGFI